MPDFPHLLLVQTIAGTHKPARGGGNNEKDPRTLANIENRRNHGETLRGLTERLIIERSQVIEERSKVGLPHLPGADAIPVFLQVDTSLFNIESLENLGIEIIAEEDDGYIIGASTDGFVSLNEKINKFIQEEGKFKNQAAQLWEIVSGNRWRPEQILSAGLLEKWPTIQDDEQFVVDISIACYLHKPAQPLAEEGEAEDHYLFRLEKWQTKIRLIDLRQSEIADQRQATIQEFLTLLNAKINPNVVYFDDSFCFSASMSGGALKDFVRNYPYVFEVNEFEEIEQELVIDGQTVGTELEILDPADDAPKVCVIDSGIQESHRLLATAVIQSASVNYEPYDGTTSDLFAHGGHGTRVAGAIIYGENIPMQGRYRPHCFIYNARILNYQCMLSSLLYPPALMEDIVHQFNEAKIFNLSVAGGIPCRTVHMSPWATAIDKLSHENDKLFIIATGNIKKQTGTINNPGIIEHRAAGRDYPNYLLANSCRIANPSQSHFGLSVGSVCLSHFNDLDRESFGHRDMISSFSRTGLGMWGAIKPEVVEYGGDWVKEKRGPNLSNHPDVTPLLVRAGGSGVDRAAVGTSFSAPKVTHIASKLQAALPGRSAIYYKTLIIQSARHPDSFFRRPTLTSVRTFGYGIPNLRRALENSERRVTLVDSNSIAPGVANLYTVNIPSELRRQGEDYDILIEVALSFTALPRRTRKKTQSYLSSWLGWESAKLGEPYETFRSRVLKNIDNPEPQASTDMDSIPWFIKTRTDWGSIHGVKRQDSSSQKDWVILKSNNLPEQLCFAVIGHKGWENDLSKEVPFTLAVSIEALEGELEIYESIRISNQIEIEGEQEIRINI